MPGPSYTDVDYPTLMASTDAEMGHLMVHGKISDHETGMQDPAIGGGR